MGRIVEISSAGRAIHKERGFLAIREGSVTMGRVPLDDIDVVIAAAQGLFWSGNSLAALAERSVPIVLVDRNFAPTAHILPIVGHHNQGTIMQAQADAPKPLRKRIWADIIKRKISAQHATLLRFDIDASRLARLKTDVRSGDPDNREAAAAQYYWRALFGSDFTRDRNAVGQNAALNYGYAILRAATARAIVAAGLNPALSVHHVSSGDALRLADDLMEPFRPVIDMIVLALHDKLQEGLSPIIKAQLASVLQVDYLTPSGHSPLSHVLVRLCQSLARHYQNPAEKMDWPNTPLPLEIEPAGGA